MSDTQLGPIQDKANVCVKGIVLFTHIPKWKSPSLTKLFHVGEAINTLNYGIVLKDSDT